MTKTLRAQAEQRGAIIRLNTIVKELHWSANTIDLVCSVNGDVEKIEGSRALITLPLGVLQAPSGARAAVEFVPGLPEDKRAAIRGVAMGHVVRVILCFRERFWETLDLPGTGHGEDLSQLGFIHYPAVPFPTWWTLLPVRAPLLVGWVGGPNSDQFTGKDTDDVLQQALISLEQIMAVSNKRLRELMAESYVHDWNSDPFSRGAYSYLPVGGLEAQRSLAQPLDNTLFLAGEATSVGHIGTVHGAIESGQRAAKEILASPAP